MARRRLNATGNTDAAVEVDEVILIDPATNLPYAAAGSGGGATMKATAAAPTYVEGSTGNPLSSDLSGGLRISGSITATNPSVAATGGAVPASGTYQGVNVGGNLRGWTAVNPSGSIYAGQTDLSSIAGVTTATGNGVVGTGVQRVAIASDNTAFTVNLGTLNGAATAAKQDTMIAALGSPFQAGGSIGNTAFTANAGTNLNTSALALDATLTNQQGMAGSAIPSKVGVVGGSDGTNARALSVDTSGRAIVVGAAASGATAVGGPVQVGGIYSSTPPSLSTGQVAQISLGARGSARVELMVSGSQNALTARVDNADAIAVDGTGTALAVSARSYTYNGTTYDRVRGVANSTDTTGTGIQATGLLAQFDDVSPSTVTENQFGNLRMSANRGLVVKPYASDAEGWIYAAAASGISNTTTAVTIKAAAGAGLRNHITDIQIDSDALGAATEFAIRDGAGGTVLWRSKLGTAGQPGGFAASFRMPIRGTANTLLEIVTLTASITGAVYFNAQGYSAP